MSKQHTIISHSSDPSSVEANISSITDRITQQGDKEHVTVQRQLEILEQLSQFELGRFLLINRGLNGYWINYILMHPHRDRFSGLPDYNIKSNLELFLLTESPLLLATQQRYTIFLEQNQQRVKNGVNLSSIPCGMLSELLYLDFSNIDEITLTGVDADNNALQEAKQAAIKKDLQKFTTLKQADAWDLKTENQYDLISSNGLTIYEPDPKRIFSLYQQFQRALKPGGKLVTSFITQPPWLTNQCEWDMTQINTDDLQLQRIIFIDLLDVKWQGYTSTEATRTQLIEAGFKDINFIYDKAHMFPTVVAYK